MSFDYRDPLIKKPSDWLDENYPYWSTEVLNIGEPELSSEIESAAIAFDEESGDFRFLMNPEFAASLSDDERAFLMSHEAMHVVRNDIAEALSGKYENREAFNIASDCIINDTLIHAGMNAPATACTGDKVVGFNTKDMDVADLYELLKEQQQKQQEPQSGDDESGEGEGEPGESEGSKDGSEQPSGQSMSGGGHEGWDEAMAKAAQAKNEEGPAAKGKRGYNDEGSDEVGEDEDAEDPDADYEIDALPAISEKDIPRIDWDKLFKKLEPELVEGFGLGRPPRADWRSPRKDMMALYPRVIMPRKRPDPRKLALTNRMMQIVVMLDNSGSVSPADKAIFKEIAKQLPANRAEYIYVAVADWGAEISREDIFANKPLPYVGSGGGNSMHKNASWRMRADGKIVSSCTEMDAGNAWILDAIESGRLRSYPKAVLYIGDGQSYLSDWVAGSKPKEQAPAWTCLVNNTRVYGTAEGRERMRRGYRGNQYGRKCNLQPEQFITASEITRKADRMPSRGGLKV